MEQIRLQKFLSTAGVASRRAAEELIKNGKVKINGILAQIGQKINPDKDKVEVNDSLITAAEKMIYLVLNKPTDYTTTRSDRFASKTIYDLLPKDLKNKVWPIGRLDRDSCGLIILTNDGELTQRLTHPKFEHEKEYLVNFRGTLDEDKIAHLEKGVMFRGEKSAPCKAELLNKSEVKIILKEGRKRQIRDMLSAVHVHVTFLRRVREGRLTIDRVPVGKYKIISRKNII
ncbi:MAG: pseudouridine synthase [Patescibacteria group bacterium]